jgi:hypothetical protein
MVSAPGAAKETVLDLNGQPQGFSADGRSLVLRIPHSPFYESDVYLQQLDGSAAVMLGKGNVDAARWMSITPDGQWIQVSRQSPPLVLLPTGAGQERAIQFPGVNAATVMGVAGAKWLLRGNLEGRGGSAHGYYLGDPGTQQVEKLKFEETGDKTAALLAPDHSRVVFHDSGGAAKWNVARVDVEGTISPLAMERGELVYGWAADSRSVYVARPGGAEMKVDRMDVETGRRTPWRTIASGRPDVLLSYLSVTPDGSAWAISRNRALDRLILAEGLA